MSYICIIGHKGNMGRRYGAILNYIGTPWKGVDVETSPLEDLSIVRGAKGFIIATPSGLHSGHVRMALKLEKPILVEKPLAFSIETVHDLCDEAERRKVPLQMVNQYRHMGLSLQDEGESCYHYWNHGRDGLAFDCISILGLARGPVGLGEKSPIWRCMINGRRLDISRMDAAYISMITGWLDRPMMDTEYIRHAHRKVLEYLACQNAAPGSLSEFRPDPLQPGSRERVLC